MGRPEGRGKLGSRGASAESGARGCFGACDPGRTREAGGGGFPGDEGVLSRGHGLGTVSEVRPEVLNPATRVLCAWAGGQLWHRASCGGAWGAGASGSPGNSCPPPPRQCPPHQSCCGCWRGARGPWRAGRLGGCAAASPWHHAPARASPGTALTQPEAPYLAPAPPPAAQSPPRGHGRRGLAPRPPSAPHPAAAAKRPARPTLSNNTRSRREGCPRAGRPRSSASRRGAWLSHSGSRLLPRRAGEGDPGRAGGGPVFPGVCAPLSRAVRVSGGRGLTYVRRCSSLCVPLDVCTSTACQSPPPVGASACVLGPGRECVPGCPCPVKPEVEGDPSPSARLAVGSVVCLVGSGRSWASAPAGPGTPRGCGGGGGGLFPQAPGGLLGVCSDPEGPSGRCWRGLALCLGFPTWVRDPHPEFPGPWGQHPHGNVSGFLPVSDAAAEPGCALCWVRGQLGRGWVGTRGGGARTAPSPSAGLHAARGQLGVTGLNGNQSAY